MIVADEFLKCCTASLESNFGQLSYEMINKIKTKKNITDSSNINDLKEFIDILETKLIMFSGKHKATEICNAIRTNGIPKTADVAEEVKPVDMIKSDELDIEIKKFLTTRALPKEADILDYTKFLALKHRGNVKVIEKDVIEKVKLHVNSGIKKNTLNKEISRFLERYPQPVKSDVDDFVKYMNISKLNIDEKQVREELEKERLCRKFEEPGAFPGSSEIDQLVNTVKGKKDKEAVENLMHKQGLSYLIKDEKGVSEKSLTEFMDIVMPSETDMKDALEGMGLKHLIKTKQ
ncbi:MAG: hypothetical protein KKG76_13110 [Euryarchaeota archaeon]|nr:hypothetical protein [Euryarchaeota archaeon]